MTPAQFATAIAHVESGNNPNAPLGDGGRALGRYQIHPDELWTWTRRLTLAPFTNETWDALVTRVIEAFYPFHEAQGLTDAEIAMCWHLGHIAHPTDGDWDAAYEQKFAAALTQDAGADTSSYSGLVARIAAFYRRISGGSP